MSTTTDYIFKYLTLGDFSVGKTTLTLRFSGENIPQTSMATIGIDFKTKIVTLSSGKKVKLLLYDTAGQERFRKIASNYYNGTDCVFLVFDISNYDTFKILSYWIDELAERINKHESDFEIILIGNKHDLSESRKVSKAEAEEMASNLKMKYFEVSSLKGDGMKELIDYCMSRIDTIIKAKERMLEDSYDENNRVSKLDDVPINQNKDNKKKIGCC